MALSLFTSLHTEEVIALFTDVFSLSENASEGRLIGALVSDLIATTPPEQLIGFVSISGGRIIGCIFFSRYFVPSNQVAYILSPVAVATNMQGIGTGQQLINYGLEHLKSLDVNLIFTYGDPRFYAKVGFSQINENIVKAPFKLSQPEGWLAQSLDGQPITTMKGASTCVAALSDQMYW
ncbi:MAG: N-acetyltransferase [Agarilytica sp.]